jgi:hypothetical protein
MAACLELRRASQRRQFPRFHPSRKSLRPSVAPPREAGVCDCYTALNTARRAVRSVELWPQNRHSEELNLIGALLPGGGAPTRVRDCARHASPRRRRRRRIGRRDQWWCCSPAGSCGAGSKGRDEREAVQAAIADGAGSLTTLLVSCILVRWSCLAIIRFLSSRTLFCDVCSFLSRLARLSVLASLIFRC